MTDRHSHYAPARIMARAWELFRERYHYPWVPFRSIGRDCFTDCLKAAWREAKEVVRLAASGVEALTDAIEVVQTPVHRVGLSTSYQPDSFVIVAQLRQVRLLKEARDLAQQQM